MTEKTVKVLHDIWVVFIILLAIIFFYIAYAGAKKETIKSIKTFENAHSTKLHGSRPTTL